jgi:hypothetical protein
MKNFLISVESSLPAVTKGFGQNPVGIEAGIERCHELLQEFCRDGEAAHVAEGLLDLLLEWPHTRRIFERFVAKGCRGNESERDWDLVPLQELFDAIRAVENALIRARPTSVAEEVSAYLEHTDSHAKEHNP